MNLSDRLKSEGIDKVFEYENSHLYSPRFLPVVTLEYATLEEGVVKYPKRNEFARATIDQHQGYYHARGRGKRMETVPDFAKFLMRLAIESLEEDPAWNKDYSLILENSERRRITQRKIIERLEMWSEWNGQFFNSAMMPNGNIIHQVFTRGQYELELKINKHMNPLPIEDIPIKEIAAIFGIEENERARELLTLGFSIFLDEGPGRKTPVILTLPEELARVQDRAYFIFKLKKEKKVLEIDCENYLIMANQLGFACGY